ncbi:hypothetical protein [Sphingomonas soli]|uniref:hypothetical protein n=1 Tax=Sphingomonas soli TaxID=266127 RepID=UPI00083436E0|nr:hypothetical protein [Sphingomonas soli]
MGDRAIRRARKPFSRWSADTEQAFLLALRLSGQASKAAKEIGRGLSAAYARRQRDPDFARAWDEAVAAGQAEWAMLSAEARGPLDDGAGGGRLARGNDRIDGWDKARRGTFLRVLARTKDVREACRAAGMSSTAAYRLRGRSPPFARAWEKMLAAETPSVLDAALERAVEGWIEPIVAGGKVIGERRRYSDSLLRALLLRETAAEKRAARAEAAGAAVPRTKKGREARAREAAKAAGGYFGEGYAPREETDAALIAKLDAMERRRDRETAEAQARAWADWRARWGDLGAGRWRWGADGADDADEGEDGEDGDAPEAGGDVGVRLLT